METQEKRTHNDRRLIDWGLTALPAQRGYMTFIPES